MSSTPQDSCDIILRTLRESNLNFIVSETPFSIQICVRKRFINNYNAPGQKKVGLKVKAEDALVNENAHLMDTLEEAKKTVDDLKMTNNALQNKLEKAESEVFKICNQKKVFEAKLEKMKDSDTKAISEAKMKSLEKSVKAKEKLIIENGKKLENAIELIGNLETEIITLKEYNSKLKDVNENVIEDFPEESKSKHGLNISSLPIVQISPARTTAPPGTPPSPHTPQGSPILSPLGNTSSLSRSLDIQGVDTPSQATLSNYFAQSPSERVKDQDTEKIPDSPSLLVDYVKNLSKLNLGPRQRRHEDT